MRKKEGERHTRGPWGVPQVGPQPWGVSLQGRQMFAAWNCESRAAARAGKIRSRFFFFFFCLPGCGCLQPLTDNRRRRRRPPALSAECSPTAQQQEATLYTVCDSFVVIMEARRPPCCAKWLAQSSETLPKRRQIHTHTLTRQASFTPNETTGREESRRQGDGDRKEKERERMGNEDSQGNGDGELQH